MTVEAGKQNLHRNIGIDIVKTVAIISVVGVHFFINTKFYTVELNNINLFIQTFIQQIFLTCIPLFLMATGYLNNNTKINKEYFKKIIPIISIYLIYSIPALYYRYTIAEIPFDIGLWISQVLNFKGHRYSWYINLYFGLFLMIPFLNRMYISLEDKKEKKTLILVLILLTNMAQFMPNYWRGIYPLTYFFVGKYIRDFSPKMRISKNIIYLILVVLLQAIIEYIAAGGGKYGHILTDYTSILRLIEAFLIFILVYKIQVSNIHFREVVINISKNTLDIYLASFITDRLTYRVLKPYSISQENYLYLLIPLVLTSFVFAYLLGQIRVKYVPVEKLIMKRKSKTNKVEPYEILQSSG